MVWSIKELKWLLTLLSEALAPEQPDNHGPGGVSILAYNLFFVNFARPEVLGANG